MSTKMMRAIMVMKMMLMMLTVTLTACIKTMIDDDEFNYIMNAMMVNIMMTILIVKLDEDKVITTIQYLKNNMTMFC